MRSPYSRARPCSGQPSGYVTRETCMHSLLLSAALIVCASVSHSPVTLYLAHDVSKEAITPPIVIRSHMMPEWCIRSMLYTVPYVCYTDFSLVSCRPYTPLVLPVANVLLPATPATRISRRPPPSACMPVTYGGSCIHTSTALLSLNFMMFPLVLARMRNIALLAHG